MDHFIHNYSLNAKCIFQKRQSTLHYMLNKFFFLKNNFIIILLQPTIIYISMNSEKMNNKTLISFSIYWKNLWQNDVVSIWLGTKFMHAPLQNYIYWFFNVLTLYVLPMSAASNCASGIILMLHAWILLPLYRN